MEDPSLGLLEGNLREKVLDFSCTKMGQTSPGAAIAAIVAILIVVIAVVIFVFYSKKIVTNFNKNYKQPIKNGSRLRIRSVATGGYLVRVSEAGVPCGIEGSILCNATRQNATLWTAYLCDNCFVDDAPSGGPASKKAPPRELTKGAWMFYEIDGPTIWALSCPHGADFTTSVALAVKIDAVPTIEQNTVTYRAFFTLENPSSAFRGDNSAINSGAVIRTYAPLTTISAASIDVNPPTNSPCAQTDTRGSDAIRSAFVLEPI